MTETDMNVENPFALSHLFGAGVYLPKEKPNLKFSLDGNFGSKILHIFSIEGPGQCPVALRTPLSKIMGALMWNGMKLTSAEFGVLNLMAQKGVNMPSVEEAIQECKPIRTVLWLDQWQAETTEIRFYETGMIDTFEVLRCHSLATVLADEERKRTCWLSIKKFFEN
jgi:hypothetical protein